LELAPALVLAVGPNGAGKTNLLESLHLGTQGFSPRTRNDAQIVRFGETAGRIALVGRRGPTSLSTELLLEPSRGKRARLNGAPLRAAELLRSEAATLVFTPDRLAVVKSSPAVRRAYFDRVLARLFPARAGLSAEYGAAVGQRNAALRRTARGLSSRDAVDPWSEQVIALGTELVASRRQTLEALARPFGRFAEAFGLGAGRLVYMGDVPKREELDARLSRDLERGTTSTGPHLHDIAVLVGDRDLRSFGSQGEQRIGVLALLLAEAEVLTERRDVPPLLLLDDVLSELDPDRRRTLVELLPEQGQTLITSTSAEALPASPAQLLVVAPGTVRTA
jgi:DNA replication and repair protein RecF